MTFLERNIILFELLFIAEGLLGRRTCVGRLTLGSLRATLRLRATVGRTLVLGRLVAAGILLPAALAVATADELEVLDDDRQLRALPAAVLVFPLVVLEPAFDEDRLALGH